MLLGSLTLHSHVVRRVRSALLLLSYASLLKLSNYFFLFVRRTRSTLHLADASPHLVQSLNFSRFTPSVRFTPTSVSVSLFSLSSRAYALSPPSARLRLTSFPVPRKGFRALQRRALQPQCCRPYAGRKRRLSNCLTAAADSSNERTSRRSFVNALSVLRHASSRVRSIKLICKSVTARRTAAHRCVAASDLRFT